MDRYMKQIQALLVLVLLVSVVACSSFRGKDTEEHNQFSGLTAGQLFTQANTYLAKKEYDSSAKRFEALETMYPFNKYAEQAQLNLIFSYYQNGDYPSAAASSERFIHLYPRARHVDYAYYLRAMANFQQTRGTLANILPIDESFRDPGTQTQAYSDFAVLVQQFPQSVYKPDSLQRMIYLRNLFAQREMNAANYYYTRKMYVAAKERASYLIKTYPQAPSAQNALALVYHASIKLGLTKASQNALTVYQTSYHKNPPNIPS